MPIEKDIKNDIGQYLHNTPKALAVVVAAFFSGHLWVFVITAFIRSKTKGNGMMQSPTGRIAIGLIWLTGVLVPIYRLKFGDFEFDYENILQIIIPTIVIGLFFQLLLFSLFVCLGDRK